MDKVPKKIKVIKNKIKKVISYFNKYNIDGYIVPKNDNFFSEYVQHDRLKIITNFSGSAGFALILKNKNYLFVDGRYTLQAKKESGKYFKIFEIPKKSPKKLFHKKTKKIILGFDPQLFTNFSIKKMFNSNVSLKAIDDNLIDKIYKDKKKKIYLQIL